MPCYHLLTDDPKRSLHTIARDRSDALLIFGDQLKRKLTLDETEAGIMHLLDEWPENSGPHWVNPTIPVFEAP